MKKLRKMIVLIMVVCLSFVLSACGKTDNTSSDKKQNTNQTQSGKMKGTGSAEERESLQKSATNDTASDKTAKTNHALVVYFSATGTTKGVAEKIATLTDADLYEIIPAEPYTNDDLNYNNDKSRASVEMNDPNARPEIGGETISFDGYSTIYIGYPIWWGDAPRIMSTFVENHDFDGITVIPFCTSGSSGIERSRNTLTEQAGSGNWLSGEKFSGNVSNTDLQSWIEEFQ